MSDHVTAAIRRLTNIFGEPQCEDPAAYVAELREAFSDTPAPLLGKAVSMAIQRCKFFPRPAEINGFINAIAADEATQARRTAPPTVEPDLPRPTPEQKARARALMDGLRKMIADKKLSERTTAPPKFPDVTRETFRAMQAASPNHGLHRKTLTATSRRMSGDFE